jgi:predicted nucleic acid-binding protein
MTRFSLDANVLVYAADRTAGERHERTLHILDRAVRRDCVLTLQALAEFFHVTTRAQMVAGKPRPAARLGDRVSDHPS